MRSLLDEVGNVVTPPVTPSIRNSATTRRVGEWLAKVGESIYSTRGGPWNPVDGQYGFTYKSGKYFVHLLAGYTGNVFTTPVLPAKVTGCTGLLTGRKLEHKLMDDGRLEISAIDRDAHLADTVVMITTELPVK